MARPLRIEYEGAWYHVMNRSAGRQAVFTADDQRDYLLSLLADTADRFNAEWHAYRLMGNHYHLLLRTPAGNQLTPRFALRLQVGLGVGFPARKLVIKSNANMAEAHS